MNKPEKDLQNLFFRDFPPEKKGFLFSLLDEISLDEGDILFSAGQQGDGIFFIAEGRLAVQERTGFAERTQVVALLERGAPVGEGALLPGHIHSATLLAVKKTRIFTLSRKRYLQLKEADPELAVELLEFVFARTCLRLQKSSERLSRVL
ncbi:Crp/Fnr family transcriptional regulator [Desulfomarina sp.]